MRALRIEIVVLGIISPFLIAFIADLLRFVLPAIVEFFIHPSVSDTMRQIILQPRWEFYNLFSFRGLNDFFFIFGAGAIFWAPILAMTWAFKRPDLAVIPAAAGFIFLGHEYLATTFNPDAQGALVYVFGPIYALGVVGVVFMIIKLGQYILPKFHRF